MAIPGMNVVRALQQEKQQISGRIRSCRTETQQLTSKLRVIDSTIKALATPSGNANTTTVPQHRNVSRATKTVGKRRNMPQVVAGRGRTKGQKQLTIRGLKNYAKNPGARRLASRARHTGMSSMEMARQVLRNAGKELSADDILQGIRADYKVTPAPSTKQMLYKRAHAGTGFYRTKNGLYGVLEAEEVQPLAAAA